MMKPLVLKINSDNPHQASKGQAFTVHDIITKFNIKSPNNRICITDRSPSTTRSISKSINSQFFKRNSPKQGDFRARQNNSCFNKVKPAINLNTNTKSIFLYDKTERKLKDQKEALSKSQNKLALNLKPLNKKQDKQIVSKLVKEIKGHKQLNTKENRNSFNKQLEKDKKEKNVKFQRPLTDRFEKKSNFHNQIQSFSNLKMDKLQNKSKFPQNYIQQFDKPHQFLRKGSNASTLSLRTKHTVSMQQFEEYEQLFAKQPSKDGKQLNTKIQSGDRTLNLLEKVKQKIYSQIYSLDKKLLKEKLMEKQKKSITISLKKKEKIAEEKQEGQVFSIRDI